MSLERWAADEFRSVNAHIEFLLREAAVRAGRLGHAPRSIVPAHSPEPDGGANHPPPSGNDE